MEATAGQPRQTFLDALEAKAQRTLRERGTVRSFAKDAALFHTGQAGDRVLVVLSGHVKLVRVTSEGREIMVALRGPGDLVGEQAALDEGVRSASAIALDPVEALAISSRDFMAFATRTPEASSFLLRTLSARLREADGRLVEHAQHDSLGRVAARIVELAERVGTPDGDEITIAMNITQEDLAGWTGNSREAVNRAMKTFRKLGLLETGRRLITVHDLEALRRHAES